MNMLFYETKISMPAKAEGMIYDTAFKLKVVKCATQSNNSSAPIVYGVNEKQVRE